MVSGFGGMFFAQFVGGVLESLGTYTPIFIVAGLAYLVALITLHMFSQ